MSKGTHSADNFLLQAENHVFVRNINGKYISTKFRENNELILFFKKKNITKRNQDTSMAFCVFLEKL